MSWTRTEMAARAALEIVPGSVVNLGIGLPTLVADALGDVSSVWIHSENGLLGMGPFPWEGDEDPQLINAGKQTVTSVPGASCFDSALSFTMIRGGHINLCVLGAMQVAVGGDLANWAVPGGRIQGMGGAMDLATGARRVVAVMTHTSRLGDAKLVEACSFPLTAQGVVDRVITDLGVFDIEVDAFRVAELAPGVSMAEVEAVTAAPVRANGD